MDGHDMLTTGDSYAQKDGRCTVRSLRQIGLCAAVIGFTTFGGPGTLAGASPAPWLRLVVEARTGLPLGDVLWTGKQFLYTAEGRRTVYVADAHGANLHGFTTLAGNKGEMRCILSPGTHGFPTGTVYCHASEGTIYAISQDGQTVTSLATVPTSHSSDGALTSDSGGTFGDRLLAATGGSDAGPGGVFAIDAHGTVTHIGDYAGPGGAEHIAIAPPGFGAVAGQVLISIDRHDHLGRLLAMDARGTVTTVVKGLEWGLNPIIPMVPTQRAPSGGPAAGIYLADWLTHDVFFAGAGQLSAMAGDVLVGTERHALLYLVRPSGAGYSVAPIATNLHANDYNLEGGAYLAP
jgi:hypothetical protein